MQKQYNNSEKKTSEKGPFDVVNDPDVLAHIELSTKACKS